MHLRLKERYCFRSPLRILFLLLASGAMTVTAKKIELTNRARQVAYRTDETDSSPLRANTPTRDPIAIADNVMLVLFICITVIISGGDELVQPGRGLFEKHTCISRPLDDVVMHCARLAMLTTLLTADTLRLFSHRL